MTSDVNPKRAVCKCGELLPEYADRATLAEIISKRLFPVTARTIRSWPLIVKHPNKKAVHNVKEALDFAAEKLASTPGFKQQGC